MQFFFIRKYKIAPQNLHREKMPIQLHEIVSMFFAGSEMFVFIYELTLMN